jgi:hypothetical protein
MSVCLYTAFDVGQVVLGNLVMADLGLALPLGVCAALTCALTERVIVPLISPSLFTVVVLALTALLSVKMVLMM